MKKIHLIICIFIGSISSFAQPQQDEERRWLILLTKEEGHPQLQEQMGAIEAHREAAIERKIGVIQLTNRGAKSLFNSSAQTPRIAETFQNMSSEHTDFEVILIGLDKTVKLRRKKAILIDELFDLIDSMPMRQEEIQRQKRVERLEEEREEDRRNHK